MTVVPRLPVPSPMAIVIAVPGHIGRAIGAVEVISQGIVALHGELVAMREDIAGMRAEVSGLREEMSVVREHVVRLDADVHPMSQDVHELGGQIGDLSTKLDGVAALGARFGGRRRRPLE